MSVEINVTNEIVEINEVSEIVEINVTGGIGPAGAGVPAGGTTGQVLAKDSNDDYDTEWIDINAIPYVGATANVDLGEFELKAGQIEFDQSPTGTAGVGVLRWNNQDGTLDLGLIGGNVTLQIGQEEVQRVVNKSGILLTEAAYQVVKVTSAQGQRLAVDLAQGNNDANSTDTLGIVTENISNNQEGYITTSGLVRGIDTRGVLQGETWIDGDVLYLSPFTAGAITNIKPTAPNHTVILGYVVHAHPTQGKIFVKCDNGYEIGELHNVYAPTPSNNDGIFWNTANLRYQNNSISGILGYTPQAALTLTTTGTSGAATLVGATLNIPQYAAGITGSGVANQLTYWNGTGSVTGSTGLVYNDSTGVMTLSKNQNAATSIAITNTNNNASTDASLVLISNSGQATYGKMSTGRSYKIISGGDAFIYNSSADIAIQSDVGGGKIKFASGNSSTAQMTLTAAGRLLLGTTTESTYLLDVNGTARVSGGDQYYGFIINNTTNRQTTLNFAIAGVNKWTFGSDFGANGTKDFYIYDNTNLRNPLYVSASGDVSVGGNVGYFGSQNLKLFYNGIALFNKRGDTQYDTYIGDGVLYNNTINFQYNINAVTAGTINYVGYLAGTTQFRDLLIADGKNNIIAKFEGSSKSLNVGDSTMNASSILSANSTTKGFLQPRMTTTERNAIATPATGLQVYNTTTNTNDVYNGTAWVALASGNIYTADGTLSGNRTVTMGSNTLSFSGDVLVNGLTIGKGGGNIATNMAIGISALLNNVTGIRNIAIGSSALIANTNNSNISIGFDSSKLNTTGSQNTIIGTFAFQNNVGGSNNTGLGYSALSGNTSGTDNTAVGLSSMAGVNTGSYNSALGLQSLVSNTSGSEGAAFGYLSLGSNTTGAKNSGFGTLSLYGNTTGSNNIALGHNAGRYITGGSTANTISNNSIYIGFNTKALADNQTNQIVIGYTTTGLGSNTTVIGNSSTTDTAIYGRMLVNYSAPVLGTYALDVNGTGRFTGTIISTNAAGLYLTNPASYIQINNGSLFLGDAPSLVGGGAVGFGFRGSAFIFGTGSIGYHYLTNNYALFSSQSGAVDLSSGIPTSAVLEARSTTRGFLPPRMTNAQRIAIGTPAVGLMVYCTDATEGLYIYKSTGWTFVI